MKRKMMLKSMATPMLALSLLGAGAAWNAARAQTTDSTTNPNYYAGRTDQYGRTNYGGGGSHWGWLGLLGLLGLFGARGRHRSTYDTTSRTGTTFDRTETYEPRPTR